MKLHPVTSWPGLLLYRSSYYAKISKFMVITKTIASHIVKSCSNVCVEKFS